MANSEIGEQPLVEKLTREMLRRRLGACANSQCVGSFVRAERHIFVSMPWNGFGGEILPAGEIVRQAGIVNNSDVVDAGYMALEPAAHFIERVGLTGSLFKQLAEAQATNPEDLGVLTIYGQELISIVSRQSAVFSAVGSEVAREHTVDVAKDIVGNGFVVIAQGQGR